jgi:small-conductance mechanosensitive channel
MNSINDILALLRSWSQLSLLRVVLIAGAAWLLVRLTDRGLPWLANRVSGRLRLALLPWLPVVRLAIVAVALGLIVPLLIHPTPENLLAILGSAAVATGFAFKDYLSSLIAGIVAIYERPYRVGDWVQIGGAYGEIRAMGLRTLRLVTADDTVVVIPHSRLWDSHVYNASDGSRDLQCVADFYVRPQHDAGQVREALYDVALTSALLHLDRPIRVGVKEEPWGTHYRLRAHPFDGRDQFRFVSDLTVRGKAALLRLGVELATAVPGVAAQATA